MSNRRSGFKKQLAVAAGLVLPAMLMAAPVSRVPGAPKTEYDSRYEKRRKGKNRKRIRHPHKRRSTIRIANRAQTIINSMTAWQRNQWSRAFGKSTWGDEKPEKVRARKMKIKTLEYYANLDRGTDAFTRVLQEAMLRA